MKDFITMKKFFKEYFSFSKREQNGLFVLFGVLLALIVAKTIVSSRNAETRVDYQSFETEIDSFLYYQQTHFDDASLFAFDPNNASREDFLRLGLSPKSVNGIMNYREKGYKFYKSEDLQRVHSLKPEEYEIIKDYVVIEKTSFQRNYDDYGHSRNSGKYGKSEKKVADLFVFDPNIATKEDFERLGFKTWQAENIVKYRSRGGSFKQPSDLSKIYGLDEDFVASLMPYIEISSQNESVQADILINLNTATAEDLQQLRGIGAAYSRRIIEYREKLGGFVAVEQLREVYGITEDLYSSISQSLELDTKSVRTININKADFKALISHPYIDKDMTEAILNYREYAGKIKSSDELLRQKALNKEQYDKISKYISVE